MKFKVLNLALAVLLSVVSMSSIAQEKNGKCGQEPTEPSIVDGSSSTPEELIASSNEVKAFIAAADEYLDCQTAEYQGGKLSDNRKAKVADIIKQLTIRRNDIGDEFNAQYQAYKAANPS